MEASIHPSIHPSDLHCIRPSRTRARDNAHLLGRDAVRLGALGTDKRVGVADGVGPREERGDGRPDSEVAVHVPCARARARAGGRRWVQLARERMQ
jgi:hypothetical protein